MWRSVLLMIALAPITVHAAGPCPELVGRWAWGPVKAVAADMTRVVFGSGGVIAVADLTRPEVPTIVGSTTIPGVAFEIALSGESAYVAAWNGGLVVVDLSSPSHPLVAGHYDTTGYARGVTVRGHIAYVTTDSGLRILNVSDPGRITELGAIETEGTAWKVAVEGPFAFVADDSKGLRVIDVLSPMRPTEIGWIDTPGRARGVAVVGDLVVVADTQSIRMIDVSDPTAPVEVGSLQAWVEDVAVVGKFAYLADSSAGLRTVDISNPASPTELDSAWWRGVSKDVAVRGSMVLVAGEWGGLGVFDATEASDLQQLGILATPSTSNDVVVSGSLAYVANSTEGVHVIDVSSPASPREVGALDTGSAEAVALSGSTLFVAAGSSGVSILDVSDPTHPTEVGVFDTPDSAFDVKVAGGFAYVANCREGLRVVDVSTLSSPVERGVWPSGECARRVTVSGRYAYVTGDDLGLHVVDIQDPAHPTEIGAIPDLGYTYTSVVVGSRMLVATGGDGIAVVDISTPNAPAQVGSIDIEGDTQDIEVSGSTAYAVSTWGGLTVLDVTDPTAATVLGISHELPEVRGVTASGGLVFATDYMSGLGVFSAESCGAAPPLADFTFFPSWPSEGESMTFTDLSTGSPTSWQWLFSDGGTGTGRHPNHTFVTPGFATATLTAGNGFGSSTATRGFAVRPIGPPPPVAGSAVGELTIVPASAHVGGAEGTHWVTDLVLHNIGDVGTMAALYLLQPGAANTVVPAIEVWVPAGQSVLLADAVLSLFPLDSASGALLVAADAPVLQVSSRTYNLVSSGTFGQYIPGWPLAAASTDAHTSSLIQLTENSRYRTNIGFVNPTPSRLDVAVEVRRADGTSLGSQAYSVPQFGFLQVNRILRAFVGSDVDDAVATVSTSTPGARFFTYASSVDNVSGDPIFIAPVRADTGPIWVPAAAHAEGLNDTVWRTDLELANAGASPVTVTVELMRADQDNRSPASHDVTVPAGHGVRIVDALADMFSYSGSGALRIRSAGGAIGVSSRTYNQLAGSTYGQYIAGFPEGWGIWEGRSARMVQLAYSPDRSRGYRTNIGLASMADVEMGVDVRLFRGDGTFLGTRHVQLAPYAWHQETDVFAGLGLGEIRDAYAMVATTTSNARALVYASVVDNRSGDPIFMLASPDGDPP